MRKDFDDVLKRNAEIISPKVKKGTLLHLTQIREMAPEPIKPLENWRLPDEYLTYMKASLESFKIYWRRRQSVKDDLLPFLKPYYGIAEHSAFVGGKVTYGGNTSYHEHPLTDWSKLDALRCDENNENFAMLINSMRFLKEESDKEGFIPALRGVEAPFDMANALRGNALFMDLYLNPKEVHGLCDFCLEAGRWTLQHQMEAIGDQYGGVMSGFGIWMPGRSVGQVSEDAASMCSVEVYKEFGKPYTEQLLAEYDTAMFHMHTLGRHTISEVADLSKAKIIQIEDDPNQPSPMEVYKEQIHLLKDKVVAINTTSEEVRMNSDFLRQHRNILRIEVNTLKEAESISAFVAERLRD